MFSPCLVSLHAFMSLSLASRPSSRVDVNLAASLWSSQKGIFSGEAGNIPDSLEHMGFESHLQDSLKCGLFVCSGHLFQEKWAGLHPVLGGVGR